MKPGGLTGERTCTDVQDGICTIIDSVKKNTGKLLVAAHAMKT